MLQIDLAICRFFKCLPTDSKFTALSFYQKIILFDSIISEKKDNTEFIYDCFESLKPWLDKEMFFSMKEKEDNVRVNANYESGEKDFIIEENVENEDNITILED